MAITFKPITEETIELPECFELIQEIGDLLNPDNLMDIAVCLKKLSNNRMFLSNWVNQELITSTNFEEYQKNSVFPQQVIDLGGTDKFRVRANMWPVANKEKPKSWEKSLFAYQMPHDHDSDFMTIGYWGPGYETEIHEYEPKHTIGYDGEPVKLKFLERTRLGQGKVMFYRANRDIHTQIAPDKFSISINLLINNPDRDTSPRQFWFDTKHEKIDSPIHRNEIKAPLFLCKLAQFLDDKSSIPALVELAETHTNPFVCKAAIKSLMELDKTNAAYYQKKTRVIMNTTDDYTTSV